MAGPSMRQVDGRPVWVHAPPGYDPRRPEPYPLLLLHDGQNLSASRPEAAGGSWRADEAVDRLVLEEAIPPLVLAGIDHAGTGRIDEFAPHASSRARRAPIADYAAFLIERVLPTLAETWHVRTDAEGIGLGGSSMGGVATLWIAAMYPGRIRRLMAMSPSVWYGRRAILRVLRHRRLAPPARIWVDAGLREGPRVARDARALVDLLRRPGTLEVTYLEDADGDHSEAAWARRLPEALQFLWGKDETTPGVV